VPLLCHKWGKQRYIQYEIYQVCYVYAQLSWTRVYVGWVWHVAALDTHTWIDIRKAALEHMTCNRLQYIECTSGISSLLHIFWANDLCLHWAFCTGQLNRTEHWENRSSEVMKSEVPTAQEPGWTVSLAHNTCMSLSAFLVLSQEINVGHDCHSENCTVKTSDCGKGFRVRAEDSQLNMTS